jgi:hypothetical protein
MVDAGSPALLLCCHQRNQPAMFARKDCARRRGMSTYQANTTPSGFQQGPAHPIASCESYYVELPMEALDDQGSLLDTLIHFTFDTLNVQHLDLRIVAEAHALS